MPPRPLDRSADRPLWAQLRDDLLTRLVAGEFAAAFPGEWALTIEYEVSRHTVREALRRLRADGLVTAERGRVPRLAPPTEIEQPLGALYSLFAWVEAAGLVQRSVTRRLEVRADGVFAARLGLEESTPLLYLERLRLAGEQPLAVDRVWLPARLAAPLLGVDFAHTALYDELACRCGLRLQGGRERINAVVPAPAERALLGIGSGVAAFAIERVGHAHGRPVEWRHTLIRGDRFSVVAQFSPRTACPGCTGTGCCHLTVDVVHIESPHRGDDLLQRGRRQRTGLGEDQYPVAEGRIRNTDWWRAIPW